MSDGSESPLIEAESCTDLNNESAINMSARNPIRAVRASD